MSPGQDTRLLSRRTFLGAAGAAAFAGAGARMAVPHAVLAQASATVPTTLRKCVSMGPINTPDGDDQDLRAHGNLDLLTSTGTRWVKLVVRWDQVQPLPPSSVPWDRLDDPVANPGQPYLAALDAQVKLARSQSPRIGVIVMPWLFPKWANDTDHLVDGIPGDLDFFPQDRMRPEAHATGDPAATAKRLTYRVPAPEELAPDGYWGRWIDFLYRRFLRYGEGVALEVANEPNIQWWPQRDPSPEDDPFAQGELAAPRVAARMLATAQEIGDKYCNRILLAGPATWDGPKGEPEGVRDSRLYTDYATFTAALLDELDEIHFAARSRFVWTQHNYMDVLFRHGNPGAQRNRAAHARSLLVGRWSGWPQLNGDKDAPGMWLTEGGADLREKSVGGDTRMQVRLVRQNWDRMATGDGDGDGMEMVTNYLGYSEFHYDTGMRDPLEAGGAPRPLEQTWAKLPSNG
ncbi:MAG TPA: hypothetical protein VFD31_00900 [Thermoleophilaceae bacterium]|nr:hypothetical protein [Thermoleophilaceae bacterium]